MIIGVCGFGSSGSSAVTDFLKEFSSTDVLDKIEFVLPYFPDGISDLDHFLNEKPAKYLSSDVAITRFKLLVKRFEKSYNSLTNGQFSKLSKEYIDAITQCSWHGYGSTDPILFNTKFHKFFGQKICRGKIAKIYERILKRDYNGYPMRTMSFSIHPDNFMSLTRCYLKSVLYEMSDKTNKLMVVNQIFPGNNPSYYFKYFESPKAIVVDRDPRDIYAFAKKFLRSFCRAIPMDTVDNFIVYYRQLRKGIDSNNKGNVLYVRFEDMVYNFENTSKLIADYCGLKMEDRVSKIFVPQRSVNNTMVYMKYPDLEEDIKKIEHELSEYLYDFDSIKTKIDAEGGMFYGKSEYNK